MRVLTDLAALDGTIDSKEVIKFIVKPARRQRKGLLAFALATSPKRVPFEEISKLSNLETHVHANTFLVVGDSDSVEKYRTVVSFPNGQILAFDLPHGVHYIVAKNTTNGKPAPLEKLLKKRLFNITGDEPRLNSGVPLKDAPLFELEDSWVQVPDMLMRKFAVDTLIKEFGGEPIENR